MNFKYYKAEALVGLLLVISVVCTYISHWIEELLQWWHVLSTINHLVHTFSTLSLIVLFLLFINYVGWKWKMFKWLIDIPDLNGRYEGQLISSFKNASGKPEIKTCVMEIKQTASSIHVFSYFGDVGTNLRTSSSHSVSEEIVKDKNDLFKIYYIFTNESEALQVQLNNHSGTAKFKYYLDKKVLDGEYYNQRMNIGTIEVKFVQEKLLGRLVP